MINLTENLPPLKRIKQRRRIDNGVTKIIVESVMKLSSLLLICISLLCSTPLYGLDSWMTDMEKAKLLAAEQRKDLFVVYRGNS